MTIYPTCTGLTGKELADLNEIWRVRSRVHLKANPEKNRTEFVQETKILFWRAFFFAQPTASNPEHSLMKLTRKIRKNEVSGARARGSVWSKSMR